MIRKILSHTNSLVQNVVKLHSAKYRNELQEFIAQGERTISTLISAGHVPTALFVVEDDLNSAKKLATHDNIIIVAPSIMEKISTSKSPSGMLATFKIPAQPSYDQIGSGIVLVELQDPGNAGTLIRTAVAMGKKTAIFVDSVDAWNPKVVQSTAGAIGMINVFCMSWDELLAHKGNIPLCALILSQTNNPRDADLSNALIVVGNEGNGLARQRVGQCEEKMALDMPGGFESLNASIAGSIALYITTAPSLKKV